MTRPQCLEALVRFPLAGRPLDRCARTVDSFRASSTSRTRRSRDAAARGHRPSIPRSSPLSPCRPSASTGRWTGRRPEDSINRTDFLKLFGLFVDPQLLFSDDEGQRQAHAEPERLADVHRRSQEPGAPRGREERARRRDASASAVRPRHLRRHEPGGHRPARQRVPAGPDGQPPHGRHGGRPRHGLGRRASGWSSIPRLLEDSRARRASTSDVGAGDPGTSREAGRRRGRPAVPGREPGSK